MTSSMVRKLGRATGQSFAIGEGNGTFRFGTEFSEHVATLARLDGIPSDAMDVYAGAAEDGYADMVSL